MIVALLRLAPALPTVSPIVMLEKVPAVARDVSVPCWAVFLAASKAIVQYVGVTCQLDRVKREAVVAALPQHAEHTICSACASTQRTPSTPAAAPGSAPTPVQARTAARHCLCTSLLPHDPP